MKVVLPKRWSVAGLAALGLILVTPAEAARRGVDGKTVVPIKVKRLVGAF